MLTMRLLLPVSVLIESDWNLKNVSCSAFAISVMVLIESDWNLKYFIHEGIRAGWLRINRIRLEFKDYLII